MFINTHCPTWVLVSVFLLLSPPPQSMERDIQKQTFLNRNCAFRGKVSQKWKLFSQENQNQTQSMILTGDKTPSIDI